MFRKVTSLIAVVSILATQCWAAQPYTPVIADPVLEPWRWTSFPELKGLGLVMKVSFESPRIIVT